MKVHAIEIPSKIVLNKKDELTTEVQLSVNFVPVVHDGINEYEGDMYTFEVKSRANLYEVINNNFDAWLEYAIQNDTSIDSPFYLSNLKANKIAYSKELLEYYLKNNPLIINVRGTLESFAITKEKQSLMTTAYTTYLLEKQIFGTASLIWNATGDICKEITEEQLVKLAMAIKNVVNPLIAYQQNIEQLICNCQDYNEVEAIEINFKSADPRYIN